MMMVNRHNAQACERCALCFLAVDLKAKRPFAMSER